jgi:Flp pilus assembly protein TadG
MGLRGTIRKALSESSGSMTVEFVATIPVILCALVFAFEFGRALWAYDVVSRDVRAAVRYLSRAPLPVSNAFVVNAQNVAKTGVTSGGTAHFPWAGNNAATVSVNTSARSFATPAFNQTGSVISITASVPMTLTMLSFAGIGTGYTLTVTSEGRLIGS